MQSQLKVKVMSLVFKQPIQLDKDTQSDVKPRYNPIMPEINNLFDQIWNMWRILSSPARETPDTLSHLEKRDFRSSSLSVKTSFSIRTDDSPSLMMLLTVCISAHLVFTVLEQAAVVGTKEPSAEQQGRTVVDAATHSTTHLVQTNLRHGSSRRRDRMFEHTSTHSGRPHCFGLPMRAPPTWLKSVPGTFNYVSADELTLYTTCSRTGRPHQVWQRSVGQSSSHKDVLLFEETNTRATVDIALTRDAKYITINSNTRTSSEVWLVDVTMRPSVPILVRQREELVEYYVDHAHDHFYVLTNLGLDCEYKLQEINHYLLVAAGSTIHQLSLDVSYVADIVLPITGIVNAVSVDEDIAEGVVYWSDDVAAGIYRAPLTGGPAQVVIQRQSFQPTSLAVDWIGRKLYWTDTMNQRLEVANLDGSSARILLSASQGIITPRGLALDLKYTYLYWTDDTSVNRVAMDGTMMRTLIRNQCEPTSITITDRWIVWTDPCSVSIGRADADTGAISQGGINVPSQQLYGVAVFNNSLYWDDRQDGSLHRAYFGSSPTAASTGADEVVLLSDMAIDVREVRLVKKSDLAIRDQFQHPCAQNRGCGSLCLPNQWNTVSQYTCACPTGIKLNPDGKTCPKIPSTFLLVTVADTIVQISLDTLSQDALVLLDSQQNPLAIDFLLSSPESGQMLWVDPTADALLSASLQGGAPPTTLIKGIGVPQGLAVDWVSSNVYWISQGSPPQWPVGIYVARANGSFPRAIVTSQVINPRSIAVHPTMGLLFWVDQTPSSKIQRCNLDGSNRTTIVNSTGTISNIIVDYASNQLFWVNSENHELRTSDLDGTKQRVFIPRPTNPSQQYMERPFGMAKLGNQIFWTEWRTRSLIRALQTGQTSFLIRTISSFNGQQPNNIIVVNPLRPGELTPLPSPLPCSVNNGDCPQLCLAFNATHRVCGCSQHTTCNETFGVPQHLLPPPPQASTYESLLPSTSPSSSLVSVKQTSVVPTAEPRKSEDPTNAMFLGVGVVMGVVMLVILTAIVILLIVLLAFRREEARNGGSPRMNRQLHIKANSSDNRKILYRLNNTKECIPLKNINSQPQGNLNQFKGEEQEYYDTSSVKVPHRTAPSVADNPPTKPNEGVVKVEFSIEAEGDTCDIKITDGNTKLPGDTNETNGKKGQDGTTESTGVLKQPPSTEEPNSAKDPEGTKPNTDHEAQDEPKPPIVSRPIAPPRPITPTTPHPITPRGGNKAALRFNLPPEPLSVLPATPPPALPPRSPKVPLATPKENGPQEP
eukprot:Em0003g1221a